MTEELPDQIVEFEALKINRGRKKFCQCLEKKFEIDTQNHIVTCANCGAWVDPFDALVYIGEHYELERHFVQTLWEERKQIVNYKPHLIIIRELERQYRSKSMLPTCPHCGRAFFLEEIKGWQNRDTEIARREFERRKAEQHKKREGDVAQP